MQSVEEFMGFPSTDEEREAFIKKINEAFEINFDQEKINKMFAMPCDWNLEEENSN